MEFSFIPYDWHFIFSKFFTDLAQSDMGVEYGGIALPASCNTAIALMRCDEDVVLFPCWNNKGKIA